MDLVQVQAPPLSQSLESQLACQAGYAARHIEHRGAIASDAQARGIEIHRVIADYLRHLLERRVSTDYGYLRVLIADCSAEGREVLDRFLESYHFEPETILGIEMQLAVDAEWHPVEHGSGREEYGGTLDLISLPAPSEAVIDDWKSYYAIVDADTFQAKLYSLLAFCSNPAIERVTFNLRFPRYGAASRSVAYTRDDLPALKQAALRARSRQLELHAAAAAKQALTASPGRHCLGCPLLGPKCPIADVNPYAEMSPSDRVRFAVWLAEAQKENERILRSIVVAEGPASYRNENAAAWVADFELVTKRSYPLSASLPILQAWEAEPILDKLNVSGLSSLLKAKKRAVLAESLAPVAEERAESHFKIRKADEAEEEQ